MLLLKNQFISELLIVLSAWTSTIVFLCLFQKWYPHCNRKDFIKSLFQQKINMMLIIWIILLQCTLFIITIATIKMIWNVPIFELIETSWTTLLIMFGYNLILGPLGEELGWRGFLFNELRKDFNLVKSAIIVGVAWGFWHAPLWLIASDLTGVQLLQYIIYFLISIISVSIIISVFYSLNHNLLIPILIHQLFNYFMAIQTGYILHILPITSFFYLLLAVLLIIIHHKKCFDKRT